MKKSIIFLLTMATFGMAVAQNKSVWTQYSGSEKISTDKAVSRATFPKSFKLYNLDLASLRADLFEVVSNASRHKTIISLPNADGEMEQFEVVEASNFEPALQARFPEIRAFSGKGLTDKYASLKLSYSPQGIQTTVFRAEKPTEFMEPYSADHRVYAVFRSCRPAGQLPWNCQTPDEKLTTELNAQVMNLTARSGGDLKTMRLAQSCNAEYSNYFGATSAAQVGLVLAAFNNTLTRCNGIYEKDLALHLNLIDSSTKVIYYNPATDPYSTTLSSWNSQLQTTLTAQIGEANYDIGHMFGASGGGGNAGCIGCVCTNNLKGRGITSPADGIPQGDNFDIDYVAHEVGHQLGGNHTFSHNNEGTGVNKEPGSGVTIMSYAGITGQDMTNHSIDIFHQASIAQIQTNFLTKVCPITTSITANNATPVVDAGKNYIIPKSTPFALTGSASDANGDALTYCWEQNDNAGSTQTGASSVASATKTTGPNWVSFLPSSSPTRLFPKLSTILAGGLISGPLTGGDVNANSEALSSVARTLNFRLTVRDNAPYSSTPPVTVGQTQFTDVVITVDSTRGPFAVTVPNTAVTYAVGSTQTITWSVNGTNLAPINCSKVKITLSTNGGLTFPIVLSDSTANDGTEAFVIPNNITSTARIKIESVDNIFFDINNVNFAITASSNNITPTFNPITPICAGSTAPILPTTSTNGIVGAWSPSNVSNQQSATYTFTPNAGQNATTASISITVNPIPQISVNSASICSGSSVTLSATGANTFSWSPSFGLSNTIGLSVTASPTTTTTYTVIGTITSTGCSSTASAVVTVNPLPSISSVTGDSRCGPGIVTISATPGAGQTIDWFTAASGGNQFQAGSLTVSIGPVSTTTTFYALARNLSSGCVAAQRVPVTAVVNSIVSFNPFPDSIGACGNSTTINAGSGFSSYNWSNGSVNPSITPTTSGWYSCTVNQATCPVKDSFYLTLIRANINNNDTAICSGKSILLVASQNLLSNTNYAWSNGGSGITQLVSPTASTTYSLTVSANGVSCVDTVRISVSGQTPAAPASITVTPLVTNVCGARKYRYSAPSLPSGTTGYLWSFTGMALNGATIDSGNVNSQRIILSFSNNAAAVTGDSVRVQYNSICGLTNIRSVRLTNTLLSAPAAPASIVIQAVAQNVCNARKYRYIAPNLPLASTSTGAATGWNWDFIGTLSEFATIDSGDLNAQKVVLVFSNNAAAIAGDSVRLFYSSGCGDSKTRSLRLSNTALKSPAAPASITIQPIQTNVCGARKYRYIAPDLPLATTTTGAATGYIWSFIGGLSSSMTIDSGSLASQKLTVTFTSNEAAIAGDSVRVLYTSGCGNSLRRSIRLSNLKLSPPAAPASITIQIKSDLCGARTYRYIAPSVLPSATNTAGAATGYLWSAPFGLVGSTGTIDSGTVNSRIITVTYSSNAAASVGDSIKLSYTSACGNGSFRAQRLSNLAKSCLSSGNPIDSKRQGETIEISPNPSDGNFRLKIKNIQAGQEGIKITITDQLGNIVHNELLKTNFNQLDKFIQLSENIRPGMYWIRISGSKINNTMRIVIQ
jgi:hypothetical protein